MQQLVARVRRFFRLLVMAAWRNECSLDGYVHDQCHLIATCQPLGKGVVRITRVYYTTGTHRLGDIYDLHYPPVGK